MLPSLTSPNPQSFISLGRPSPLHTLSLNLFPEGFSFLPHDFAHLTTLFSAFDPIAFPKLDMIEILSTPGTDSFALQARAMAEELPERFPNLNDLKLFLGTGQTLLSLRYSAESLVSGVEEDSGWTSRADLDFSPRRNPLPMRSTLLISFSILPRAFHFPLQPLISTHALSLARSNILNEEEPSPEQARIWFECVRPFPDFIQASLTHPDCAGRSDPSSKSPSEARDHCAKEAPVSLL